MHIVSYGIALLLAVGGVCKVLAQGVELRPTYGIHLCKKDHPEVRSEWDTSILLSFSRVIRKDGQAVTLGFSRRTCADSPLQATCFAAGEFIQCDVAALERIFRVAAWYAWRYLDAGKVDYNDFYRIHEKTVLQAFGFADGTVETDTVEAFAMHMRVIDMLPADQPVPQAHKDFQHAHPLFREIVDLVMLAFLGHEAGHLNNEQCPIATRSRLDSDGLIDHLVRSDLAGELFCAKRLDRLEIKADECAIRQIEQKVNESGSVAALDHPVGEFARRVAADIVAFQAMTGWAPRNAGSSSPYRMVELPPYLSAPFRQILFAAAMHGERPKPVICGDAAALIVQGIQARYTQCPGDGHQVSDDILRMLPKGVELAWNGGDWSIDSYSCVE